MESLDRIREEFEAWLLSEHWLQSEWQPERNCFKDYAAHIAFQSWQASRACLVVTLPNKHDPIYWYEDEGLEGQCFDYPLYIKHANDSIHAAGIKTSH